MTSIRKRLAGLVLALAILAGGAAVELQHYGDGGTMNAGWVLRYGPSCGYETYGTPGFFCTDGE